MSASGKCFKRRVFNMADENTERRRTLILPKIDRQWNEEKADNGAVCFAVSLHWVENGQVSSFSLTGKHLRMLKH